MLDTQIFVHIPKRIPIEFSLKQNWSLNTAGMQLYWKNREISKLLQSIFFRNIFISIKEANYMKDYMKARR